MSDNCAVSLACEPAQLPAGVELTGPCSIDGVCRARCPSGQLASVRCFPYVRLEQECGAFQSVPLVQPDTSPELGKQLLSVEGPRKICWEGASNSSLLLLSGTVLNQMGAVSMFEKWVQPAGCEEIPLILIPPGQGLEVRLGESNPVFICK